MKDYPSLSLGIVCPMANEMATARLFVEAVLEQVAKFPFKRVTLFTVFDNVCTDGTRAILESYAKTEPRLRVIYAPENRCVVDAYMKGYHTALQEECDWILEIDAGFSHDPASIPAFLVKIRENIDVVYATRFTLGGTIVDSSLKHKCISRLGGLLSNYLLGTKLGDMTSGFILFSRQALELVLAEGIESKGPFFQTEMKYHARNLRYAEVPISYQGASHKVGKMAMADARFHLTRLAKKRFFNT